MTPKTVTRDLSAEELDGLIENPEDTIVEVETLNVSESEEPQPTFEIVPNSMRAASRTQFLVSEIAEALLADKTAKVPADFSVNSLYRWAKSNGYMLRTKRFTGTDFKVIWFEKISNIT